VIRYLQVCIMSEPSITCRCTSANKHGGDEHTRTAGPYATACSLHGPAWRGTVDPFGNHATSHLAYHTPRMCRWRALSWAHMQWCQTNQCCHAMSHYGTSEVNNKAFLACQLCQPPEARSAQKHKKYLRECGRSNPPAHGAWCTTSVDSSAHDLQGHAACSSVVPARGPVAPPPLCTS
jgi:hypothetical protein